MYSWYKRIMQDDAIHLVWEEQTSLGGCNNGVIANELKDIISNLNPPIGWSIPIADKWNNQGYSFIIDIKPSTEEAFLCELDQVFGYSYESWSPILLRLKVLCNNVQKSQFDKGQFVLPEKTEIIYTMLYLYGSFHDRQLIGTWNPPYGSITALLFWPDAMSFFFKKIKEFDPDFLESDVKEFTLNS